jgi:MFS family permease
LREPSCRTKAAAGGWLAQLALFAPYYTAVGLCAGAALIALTLIADPPLNPENFKPSIPDILAYARRRSKIIVPAIFNFVDRLHMGFIIFIIPLMLRELLGLGPQYRGIILGINGLAYIILQYPIGRLSDRIGRLKLLLTGSVGYGILLCFAGPAAALGFPALIVLFFCLGVFSGLTGPPNSALVGDIANREENPLAMGFFNLFGNVGMVCGSLFGGVLLSVASFTVAFIAAGMVELVTLALNIILIKRMRTAAEHEDSSVV